MAIKKETSKEYFKSITSMSIVLISAFLLMSAFITVLKFNDQLKIIDVENRDIIGLAVAGAIFLFTWSSRKNYLKKIQQYSVIKTIEIKMFDFRHNHISLYAKLTFATFCSFCGIYYLNEDFFWVIPAFALIVFTSTFPTKKRAINALNLNKEETEKILNPDAIICEIEGR